MLIGTAIWLAGAAPASGQLPGGRIDGRIRDADRSPLPGIELTLDSPGLPGKRTGESAGDGSFRFLQLPPGAYTLTARGPGWVTLEQTQVEVRLGHAVFLTLEMIEAFDDDEEEVAITGWSPTIDVGVFGLDHVFTEDLFRRLPLARTYDGVLAVTPGASPLGAPGPPFVHGGAPREHQTMLDGLEADDPVTGLPGLRLPWELVREVRVTTAGHEAQRQGALGGVVDVVTRSAPVRFQGSVFAFYTDESLASEDDAPAFVRSDGGLTLGGRVLDERLGWFVGGDLRRDESSPAGSVGGATALEEDRLTYLARLETRAGQAHQFSVSALGDPSDVEFTPVFGIPGTTTEEGGGERLSLYYDGLAGRYFGAVLAVGRDEQEGLLRDAEREEAQATFTVLLGSRSRGGHELRWGGMAQDTSSPVRGEAERRAVFLQDTVRFGPHFSVGLGVRGERFEAFGPALGASGRQEHLDPRLGFAWDVWNDTRSRVYGHYGRVHDPPVLGLLPFVPPGDSLDLPEVTEAALGFEAEPLPNIVVGIVGLRRDFERPSRLDRIRYEAVEVGLRKRFAAGWQLQGTYVYVDDEEPATRPHQAQVLGSYLWRHRLTTGLVVRHSGESRGRALPERTLVDLRLGFPWDLGPVTVEVLADLLNLSDEEAGFSPSGDTGPRRLRLGIRVDF